MRFRLPQVIIFLLFFLLSARPSFALEKWGMHLSNTRDPGLLAGLRQKYNSAGTTDWVPVTVLLPVNISSDELGSFLDACKANKFWPIFRVFNGKDKILSSEVDKLMPALVAVVNKTNGFPQNIFLVFGNEVNNGEDEWGGTAANPQEFTESLRYFIDQVKTKASVFKIANAAMNGSLPSQPPLLYNAITFWNEGPKSLIGDLDALAFNTYELGGGERRLTINGWKWEWEQIGSPNKPLILTEFGLQPDPKISTLTMRENYVNSEYAAFKKGERQSLDRVLAITPLLWFNGPIKIPVFSSSGTVTWYDPGEVGAGGTSGGSGGDKGTSQASALTDFINKLVSSITGNRVDTTMKQINCGALPLELCDQPQKQVSDNSFTQGNAVLGEQSVNTSAANETIGETVKEYNTAAARGQPKTEQSSRNLADFFADLLNRIKELIGLGNKRAEEWVSVNLPQEMTDETLTQSSSGERDLAWTNTEEQGQILGLFSSNENAMSKALPVNQCAALPSDLCTNNLLNGMGAVVEEPSPAVSGTPLPTAAPSEGNCSLGHGYCSVENLMKQDEEGNYLYFSDVVSATKASKICQRESGSNPLAANKGCLTGKYVDYSLGLFQINLLAHCPASLPTYTWKPPSCSFGNINERDKCERRFLDPVENIKYAVQLSGNGTNWKAWAAAGSAYCNIQ